MAAGLREALAALAAYCSISLAVVFYNKWLFNRLEVPVFVSATQQIVTVMLLAAIGGLKGKFPGLLSSQADARPRSRLLLKVVPMAASFVLMIAATNMCLKLAPVSTYQVARSLTLIFTVLFSILVLKQRVSLQVYGACLCIILGFATVASDAGNLPWLGALMGAVSSIFQAIYQVLIKYRLPDAENSHAVLLYHNTVVATLLFPICVLLVGEGQAVARLVAGSLLSGSEFVSVWGPILLSGVMAGALNYSAYWCVNATSPLTFNIAGITKAAVQALGGLVILGDPFSAKIIIGISMKLTGSSLYTWIKHREIVGDKAKDVQPDEVSPRIMYEPVGKSRRGECEKLELVSTGSRSDSSEIV